MEFTRIRRYDISGFGADQEMMNRPGVPMETNPQPLSGVHWSQPEKQVPHAKVFRRVGLDELTPVFGTCQPPRGLSGVIRENAYKIAEDKAAHWGLLLLSDRIDVAEGVLIDAFTRKPYFGFLALGGLGVVAYLFGKRTQQVNPIQVRKENL